MPLLQVAALCDAAEVMIGGRAVIGIADARDLHAGLRVGRDFTNWIKSRIEKYGFQEHVDYEVVEDLSSPNMASSKARAQIMHVYTLTLDMAKEIAMVENNERGRTIRRYYIWLEEALHANGAATPPSGKGLSVRESYMAVREIRLAHGAAASKAAWHLFPRLPQEEDLFPARRGAQEGNAKGDRAGASHPPYGESAPAPLPARVAAAPADFHLVALMAVDRVPGLTGRQRMVARMMLEHATLTPDGELIIDLVRREAVKGDMGATLNKTIGRA